MNVIVGLFCDGGAPEVVILVGELGGGFCG